MSKRGRGGGFYPNPKKFSKLCLALFSYKTRLKEVKTKNKTVEAVLFLLGGVLRLEFRKLRGEGEDGRVGGTSQLID